jgi:shikimate kinase
MSGDEARGGHLLLVGMMGSGKTTVGRLVARRLGRPFLDSDAEVERSTGRSVAQIFAADGEAAFRVEERRVLEEAVASPAPAVIAVAGGAVLDPHNRSVIEHAGTVVWLRADPATLARRVGDGRGRPLLGSDPPEALERLAEERTPLYAEVADAVVDVDGAAPKAIAGAVLATLERSA